MTSGYGKVSRRASPCTYNVPHFFTYYRTAGGAQGDLTGGYNMDFDGFIPAINATFSPGASVSTFSTLGGTQFGCDVEAQLFEGNWWIYACDAWQGYYPGPDSSEPASLRIPFDLIDDASCWAQWYGEVWDSTPTTWTNANMGSGRWPADGFRWAAYMSKLRHQTASGVVAMGSDVTWPAGDDDNCYRRGNLFARNALSLRRANAPKM